MSLFRIGSESWLGPLLVSGDAKEAMVRADCWDESVKFLAQMDLLQRACSCPTAERAVQFSSFGAAPAHPLAVPAGGVNVLKRIVGCPNAVMGKGHLLVEYALLHSRVSVDLVAVGERCLALAQGREF